MKRNHMSSNSKGKDRQKIRRRIRKILNQNEEFNSNITGKRLYNSNWGGGYTRHTFRNNMAD